MIDVSVIPWLVLLDSFVLASIMFHLFTTIRSGGSQLPFSPLLSSYMHAGLQIGQHSRFSILYTLSLSSSLALWQAPLFVCSSRFLEQVNKGASSIMQVN
jgi:hypothetical protein